MNQLRSIHIERFKAIRNAPFDLEAINVLVGANNSGKSSVIQGLHFGIGLLQTIELNGNWTSGDSISTSLNPIQLIYSPSDNVNALAMGGKLLEELESAIKFTFTLASGDQPSVSIRKGRNRNILVAVERARVAKRLASLERPFSVFSPGLAGIAKSEQYLSDGVLMRTIARGDANLVLRNILLRLWDTQEWDAFLVDLRAIFPAVEFRVKFTPATDEFIDVQSSVTGVWVPLELAGTGVLQATQILAYIHRFSPSIVVLDEPDSHLHPNNQRLLCALLRQVADERGTQVLLTTHSRHVVEAIGSSTIFLWVRNGTVERAAVDDEIGILLDIGALDVKERATQPGTRAIVLTEDQNPRFLEALLASSGFLMPETTVLPYYGVTSVKQLRPLVNMIAKVNPKATIVLHRDRDYLSDDEAAEWEASVRRLSVEPFLTESVDVEGDLLCPPYLSALNAAASTEDFERLIGAARVDTRNTSVEHYVNGRIDILRTRGEHASINHGALALEASAAVDGNSERWSHGKSVLKRLRAAFQAEFRSTLAIGHPDTHVESSSLRTVATKVFGHQHGPS